MIHDGPDVFPNNAQAIQITDITGSGVKYLMLAVRKEEMYLNVKIILGVCTDPLT